MTTSNFKHLKTYRINTDVDEIARPEESYTVRFCIHTMNTFAPVIDKLSKAFLQAQLAYQDGYLEGPARVCVFIPRTMLTYKFKKEDPETSLERIYWFVENFKKPTGGIIISFYESYSHKASIDSHWGLSNLWPLENTWAPGHDNYVTVHLPEPGSHVDWNKKDFLGMWKYIKLFLESRGVDIKYVSYSIPYEEIHKLMVNSKLHISYVGASYIFSGVTKTPTIGLGSSREMNEWMAHNIDGLPFYYSSKYPRNIFGLGPMSEDRIMQLKIERDTLRVGNDYVHHIVDTPSVNKALEYVEKALDGDYSHFESQVTPVPKVTIGKYPFFHIIIDDFLPEEEFNKLSKEALGISVQDDEVGRKILSYDPTPQIEKIIHTFYRAMEKKEYNLKMRRHDGTALKKFIHFAVTPSNFDHKMHVEAEFKIMSAVLYLAPEQNIGTRLYKTPDDKNPVEVEWKPNRLFIFCGHNHTWHDYASTDTRYTYNYFLVDPGVVRNEEYKNNLI